MELRYQLKLAMEKASTVIPKIFEDWGERTGRYYQMLEQYQMEDADYAMLTLGAFAGNAKTMVDELRDQGEKVGLLKLRTYRPFPQKELISAVKDLKGLTIIERTHALGGIGSVVYSDIRSALYDATKRPMLYGYTAGLGGRDVLMPEWKKMYYQTKEYADNEKVIPHQWWGVRK